MGQGDLEDSVTTPRFTSATRLFPPPLLPSQRGGSNRVPCQVSGTLEPHGDPSLGLLSIKDNGFYVHREVTLTLRLAQSKQTGIVKIKILPTPLPQLMTWDSCNGRLASLLENTSRSRTARRPAVTDRLENPPGSNPHPSTNSTTLKQIH